MIFIFSAWIAAGYWILWTKGRMYIQHGTLSRGSLLNYQLNEVVVFYSEHHDWSIKCVLCREESHISNHSCFLPVTWTGVDICIARQPQWWSYFGPHWMNDCILNQCPKETEWGLIIYDMGGRRQHSLVDLQAFQCLTDHTVPCSIIQLINMWATFMYNQAFGDLVWWSMGQVKYAVLTSKYCTSGIIS